jgi:hypothetical protein
MTVDARFNALKQEYDSLAEDLLDAASGRRVVYFCNPGNRGDALIRYGTKLFLEHYGIDHIEQNVAGPHGRSHALPYLSPTFPDDVLFLIGGGGAWSQSYNGGYRLARLISRGRGRLFVLPSTFEFSPSGVRGTLYRRDQGESRDAVPNSRFCHDMAFYAAIHRNELGFDRMPASSSAGIYFRSDLESRFRMSELPADNYDISAAGDHMSSADQFIRELASNRVNVTDRLHVCVGSLVARRQVYLMTGNYFKIRAIYESTIRPYFGTEIELAGEGEHPRDFAARAQQLDPADS